MQANGDMVIPGERPRCQASCPDNDRVSGIVKWFDPANGYGFIERGDGAGDVSVHYSDVEYVGFKSLYGGERVEFRVIHNPRGDRAVQVTGHNPFAY
jgi:CspA family cold shock protein